MNWKEKLRVLQKDKDWDKAIELMKETVKKNPNDSWSYVQLIYLFHNILLEENYPEEKQDDLALLLKNHFSFSKDQFSEDSEYLFFIGKILHIAEWYFGLEDNLLAIKFQEKAMKKEPNNLLFEWAYRLSLPNDIRADYLAHKLIESKSEKIKWIESKGFPGEYILEHLNMGNKRYVKKVRPT